MDPVGGPALQQEEFQRPGEIQTVPRVAALLFEAGICLFLRQSQPLVGLSS